LFSGTETLEQSPLAAINRRGNYFCTPEPGATRTSHHDLHQSVCHWCKIDVSGYSQLRGKPGDVMSFCRFRHRRLSACPLLKTILKRWQGKSKELTCNDFSRPSQSAQLKSGRDARAPGASAFELADLFRKRAGRPRSRGIRFELADQDL
jgi:hypothetical protein